MDYVKSWVLSVVSCTIITTIIFFIAPDGKIGKLIKCIFSIIISLIILKPITFVLNNDFIFDEEHLQLNTTIQTDYLNYINEKKIDLLYEQCEQILLKNGIKGAIIDFNLQFDENFQFSINDLKVYLDKAVISSSLQHIHIIDNVKNDISKNMGIHVDKILIYE